MPRRKKEKVEETIKNRDDDKFVYCHHRHCPHTECLRHHVNTPFNVMIYIKKFSPNKDWNCKDMEV